MYNEVIICVLWFFHEIVTNIHKKIIDLWKKQHLFDKETTANLSKYFEMRIYAKNVPFADLKLK